MRRTIYFLTGIALGSSVIGYLRNSGALTVIIVNAGVWFFTGIYWLGRWQRVLELRHQRDVWRRNWFYEI